MIIKSILQHKCKKTSLCLFYFLSYMTMWQHVSEALSLKVKTLLNGSFITTTSTATAVMLGRDQVFEGRKPKLSCRKTEVLFVEKEKSCTRLAIRS